MREVKAKWFGGRLKELRGRAGLTQEQLAGYAGLTREGVAQLEIGRNQPAWETVLSLCRALDVGCDAFLSEPGAGPAVAAQAPSDGLEVPEARETLAVGEEQPDKGTASQTWHLARLCYNEDNWTRPSGLAGRAEGSSKGSKPTFASENGYGHEEWLFRPEHTIDGWRYGFLQPSLKAKGSLYGKALNVVLYTIDPDNGRWYLGRIDGLVVLDEPEALGAHTDFARRGWLMSMRDDLSDLDLSPQYLLPAARTRDACTVNVRYQPSKVYMLPEPVKAPAGDVTNKRGKNRYRFYQLQEVPKCIVGKRADPNRAVGGYSYQMPPSVHADRRHNQLQLRLVRMLREKYGFDAVRFEVDGVDIMLTQSDGVVFVEVKSQPDARLAIRIALGQVLEYSLFPGRNSPKSPELVVAAPGPVDWAVEEYIKRLRRQFGLPIRYVPFNEDTAECPL